MRLTILFIFLFKLSAPAQAQTELIRQLADQVCSCMETVDRNLSPSEQAQDCVLEVGLKNKKVVLDQLGLDTETPEQLRLISDRMSYVLSEECPLLSTLDLSVAERELRWSDGNVVRDVKVAAGFKFPKNPPADLPSETVSEPLLSFQVTGSVSGNAGRGNLRLRLPDGTTQNFEFPAAVSRKSDLSEGQVITVTCSRQWRKTESGGIVALVVQTVE